MSSAIATVFVVDDDVSVRESLELLIESVGWRARTFASAHEFLAHPALQDGPSCLVLDASLQDLNGLHLTGSRILDQREIPVILISGYDAGDAMVQALKVGAVAFLMKPLDAGALLDAIERAIGPSRTARGREGDA
jgi:FixJ family two-component response regulator